MPRIETFKVGNFPSALLFDGESIWVANQDDDNLLKLGLDGKILATVPTQTFPRTLAFDGQSLWVGTYFAVIRHQPGGQFTGAFGVGRHPASSVFAGGYVWIANNRDNTVSRFDSSGTKVNTEVGTRPISLAFDGESIWVANQGDNTVSKLSLDGQELGTFAVGMGPRGLAFDGSHIWVTIRSMALCQS